jgi:hypothetical protein
MDFPTEEEEFELMYGEELNMVNEDDGKSRNFNIKIQFGNLENFYF